jgi:hypothetical protein
MTKVGNTLNVDDAFLKNNVSDTMSGSLTIAGNILLGSSSVTNDTKELRFVEGANYVGFEAPNLTADQIWILPAADGSSSQMLTTDGNGTLSWSSASSGDVTDVIGGNGLDSDASTGDITLTLNLGELTDTAIAAGDDIVFIDSSNSNASVKGDISDLADLFAGTSLTASSSVISVDDDFVKNTHDVMTDTTSTLTTLEVVKTYSTTSASVIKGAKVRVQKTASTSSDNTIYGVDIDVDNSTASSGTNVMIGLRADANLRGAADAGTLTTKGAVITATGDTNGTSVATAMELTTSGADTNSGLVINCADGGADLKLVSSADVTDYATLTVGASGATTLTTVDAGAAIAHLTLTIDGSLIVAGATGIDIGAVNGAGNSPLTNIHIDGGSF